MARLYSLSSVSEEVGEYISRAVQTFAETRSKQFGENIQFDLWHQDAPIWVVSDLPLGKSNVGPVVHKLEIGVFSTDNSLEIRVIPDVYQIQKGARQALAPHERAELSASVPLDNFLASLVVEPAAGVKLLSGRLTEVWDKIKGKSAPEDLSGMS